MTAPAASAPAAARPAPPGTSALRRAWAAVSSIWVGLFLLVNMGGLALFILLRYDGPEPYFLSPLYLGLLGAFGVNIACVLASRYRFRLAQAGFLLTHVGIVTTLAGGALTHWRGEDGQMRIPEGGAEGRFLVERADGLYRAKEIRVAGGGGLREAFRFDAAPPARLPSFEAGGFRVDILQHLPHAGRRREILPAAGAQTGAAAPMALRFRVGMAVASVEDWLQADDPGMGVREAGNGLTVRYLRGGAADAPQGKSLAFLESPDGVLILLERDGKGREEAQPVGIGVPVRCRFSPLEACALERREAFVTEGFAPSARGGEEALRLRVSREGEERVLWAAWNEPVGVAVGGDRLWLNFTNPERELGFSLRLVDFLKRDYEGSALPMSYESRLVLEDPGAGVPRREVVVGMNAPLVHRGWTFFQAAFSPARPGEPEATVLQVSRDPGKPVVYTGALLVVSGIVFMFYVKPWMKGRGLI